MFSSRLPLSRYRKVSFKDARPSEGFIANALAWNRYIFFKRRASLENHRAVAMRSLNKAKNSGRLSQVYKKYRITIAENVFHLFKRGFSTRT